MVLMGMTRGRTAEIPVLNCTVFINDKPLPEEARAEVTSITVTQDVENRGMFTLVLRDWDAARQEVKWVDHELFAEGNEVKIKVGYQGDATLTTLIVGEITSLESEFTAQQLPRLTVRGYDYRSRLLRGHKTITYRETTDSEIAAKIAREAGLQAEVEPTSISIISVSQPNQTDLSFLQDSARLIGYEVFVEQRTLYFRPAQANKRPSLSLSLTKDLAEFSPRFVAPQVEQVELQTWDPQQKQPIKSTARVQATTNAHGGSSRSRSSSASSTARVVLTAPVVNQAEADQIVRSHTQEIEQSAITAEGECLIGRPDLSAGVTITIEGAGKRFSGLYYVTSVNHTISSNEGYRTTFSAKRKTS